ncbi:hypothetical protein [Brevundimonas balnearis]|uniref:Tat pathway signal sequence domain protein n=1 Tax=Brevundimonas balnearis TaxID=1572858 RepID=A0ABV6R4G1_9CAUL
MARTSTPSQAAPARQQMDRSNDPDVTRAMDIAAPEAAMSSRRQRYAGSAAGVGSVGIEETGAYDVGAGGEAVEPTPLPTPQPDLGHTAGDTPADDQLRAGGIGPDGTPGPDPAVGPGLGAASLRRDRHDADERAPSDGEGD